ncbi:hypothetical protein GPZ77_34245 (plasmid) [Streptomyces sp. QHH-9511]|uniref:hypothetical protein n=1 Tax=Streptomyces sp. QHH-9511 TaxID=2684468 RepID=UPI0013168398|nr:hypothetical protein [Streptomyces sp. QHH-9511]QGZ53293.1 hypothetical protein GPZ77_34245 [Streptomyces sp. QHH-9511]
MARHAKRPYVKHAARAAEMRDQPGTWIEVGIYRSRPVSMAREIRTAERLVSYQPPGAYETRIDLVDTGYALYARYTLQARTPSRS